MFRRRGNNKNTVPSDDEFSATPSVGDSTEGVETIEQAHKSYYEEVMERIGRITGKQGDLLRGAVDRGIPSADLASLVADAMNSGAVPRIVQNPLATRNYVGLILLDGEVQPDDLYVHAEIIPEHSVPSPDPRIPERFLESYFDWSISPAASITAAPEGGRLQVEYASLPRIDSGQPVDAAILEKVDAHMGTPPGG